MIAILASTILAFVIAFAGSIPIAGPIAVLVVDRAMKGDRRGGMSLALGGALVEGLYAFGAALVFPLLVARSASVIMTARGLGAALIGTFGLVLLIRPSVLRRGDQPSKRQSFMTGVTMTALNPTLVATWLLVAATLYAHDILGPRVIQAVLFGVGVLGGVFAWFAIVLRFSDWTARVLDGNHRLQVIRFLGGVLLLASAYLGMRFVNEWRARGHASEPVSGWSLGQTF